jgi:hypothetical protein
MPVNNSNFVGIDGYCLSAVGCVPALKMKTRIIHISSIDWILQLVS